MRSFYILKQAIHNIWSARVPVMIAIVTIGISLSVLLGISEIAYKVYSTVENIRKEFEIDVFLDPEISSFQRKIIERKLENIHQIKSYKFISKEDAAKIFFEEFGEDIFDILTYNPLPASYKIKLYGKMTHMRIVDNVVNRINKINGIDEIKYHNDLLILMEKYFLIIMIIGGSIIFVLLLAMNIFIRNTIKLSVYSRRRQIFILQLLGSGKIFLKSPFIIEGLFEGLIGGFFAATILYFFHNIANETAIYLFNYNLEKINYIWSISIIAGGIIGVFASSTSVNKFVRIFAKNDY
ncbi:MAG: permease-like cell division protein FtsX [Candidatus Marinimicrobia bacterium]|nr:permease-like cell division protein FtsX [Candidatus Neomarinimicrobiota bacterium]